MLGDLLDCGRSEAMTTSEPKVCLEIGSRTENVELVQIAVKASLQQLKLDRETSQSIGTAVREAVANAIQHGNSLDPDKHVRIECCVDGDEVVIRVRDQGNGFDPKRVPDPLDPENLMRPNGRGIFFMKSFMDEVVYSFPNENGTRVEMVKKIPVSEGS